MPRVTWKLFVEGGRACQPGAPHSCIIRSISHKNLPVSISASGVRVSACFRGPVRKGSFSPELELQIWTNFASWDIPCLQS